jgi:hypothetical protein
MRGEPRTARYDRFTAVQEMFGVTPGRVSMMTLPVAMSTTWIIHAPEEERGRYYDTGLDDGCSAAHLYH